MPLRIQTFVAGPLDNNIYLLHDDNARQSVLIDPSIASDAALAAAQAVPNVLAAIWNTHGHFDHIYDNARWKDAFDVPLWAYPGDEYFLEHLAEMALWFGLPAPRTAQPDALFHTDDEVRVGSHIARVLHTPGHSPGSVSFYFEADAVCVSGDVIFRGSAGRTDLPLCSREELNDSLARLAGLPSATRLLPGHGGATTVGAELADNPFVRHLRDG